jgi:sporulation protein YtfJ
MENHVSIILLNGGVGVEDSFNGAIENLMRKLKEMAETEVMVGEPINVNENVTIIPISKVSLGFAFGGSESTREKKERAMVNLGSGGGGISFTPLGFLVINNGEVKLIELGTKNQLLEFLEGIPELYTMFSELFKKNSKKNKESERGAKD